MGGLDILEEWHKEALRRAATNVVDAMHNFKPDAILLCGTSSQPAFSLVAEAWRRRYPGKPLPSVMPVTMANHSDVKGKRVVLFDELFLHGASLHGAFETISKLKPAKVKKIALMHSSYKKPRDVEVGEPTMSLAGINPNWLFETDLRQQLRYDGNKEKRRRLAASIRQRREEFRQIASSIQPAQQRKTLWERVKLRLRVK